MNRIYIPVFAAALLAFAASPLFASKPIYMKYGDIRAVVEDIDFAGLTPRDVATGQSSGKRQYQPIIIRKRIDKSSPLLMKSSANGKQMPTVDLEFTKQDANGREQTYMVVKMQDVLISSYQTSGAGDGSTRSGGMKTNRTGAAAPSSGQDRPMESLSLNFTKIELRRLDGKTTMTDDWSK